MCVEGCFCEEGYVRDGDGTCISDKECENVLNLPNFITLSDAVVHPEVNGLWLKQDGTNGGKVVFKHSESSLFLHADTRTCCHGNWHINSQIKGGEVFYWAGQSLNFPMQKGGFYVASTSPPEQSELVITLGDGCYEDNQSRILSTYIGDFPNNKKSVCMAACSDYKFAGVQYGTQCFCGNDQPDPSLLRPDQCTMTCPGNSNENCGGFWRMNVYSTNGMS